jgi:hypothetical protein
MRGADAFGPFLRAGCAGAAWVRGGSLGSGMRAGRRCLAPRVGGGRWSGSPSSDADTRARCVGGHVGFSTLCLPTVRGRACVGAWAGAESGGSFGVFAAVAVWAIPRLLRWGPVLCGKVPNNAYSQGSQEFSASAIPYRPGSLTDAQEQAVACPHARLSASLFHICLASGASILFMSKNHDTPKSLHNFTTSEPCRNN